MKKIIIVIILSSISSYGNAEVTGKVNGLIGYSGGLSYGILNDVLLFDEHSALAIDLVHAAGPTKSRSGGRYCYSDIGFDTHSHPGFCTESEFCCEWSSTIHTTESATVLGLGYRYHFTSGWYFGSLYMSVMPTIESTREVNILTFENDVNPKVPYKSPKVKSKMSPAISFGKNWELGGGLIMGFNFLRVLPKDYEDSSGNIVLNDFGVTSIGYSVGYAY